MQCRKIVNWEYHVDDSITIMYGMRLGSYILTTSGIDIKTHKIPHPKETYHMKGSQHLWLT